MNITTEEVLHISKLSKIKLTGEELLKTTEQFEEILHLMKCIGKLNLQNEVVMQSDEKAQRLRKDEVIPFENTIKLFQNTRDMKDGYIRIPKIIE
ncbi:MAG: Asp-tRNA(Asn)/Glu-tRNA(Gln) amidotransferase subunit GatC [Alkaliphilus sp.]